MNTNNEKGLVFNIQKFSIHDGIGIRTLVFMKGCPLKCKWCANPESQSFKKEIMFLKEKCIGCGSCSSNCPQNGIDIETYTINRAICDGCGQCAKHCYANAKKTIGESMTIDQIMEKVEKDRIFYRNSNGGVTVGGGEPLAQADFVAKLIKRLKESHIHTAIETCGYAPWEKCEDIFRNLDQVFFDIKHMDSKKHKEITGVSNELILENAKRLASLDGNRNIVFRIPLIPGYNQEDENIIETGRFIGALSKENTNIETEILLYHNMGENKYNGLDKQYELKGVKASEKEIKAKYAELLKGLGCRVL